MCNVSRVGRAAYIEQSAHKSGTVRASKSLCSEDCSVALCCVERLGCVMGCTGT